MSGAVAQAQGGAVAAQDDQTSAESGQDIVVTATRTAVGLSKVPISVAAFSQAQMDQRGLRQVDDLVGITPGLALERSSQGANRISIRGINSSAGSGTTGVYIDDTPIQVRNQGFGSGTAFPEIFDLERVEVLRGPQGTLFGSGSMGGTVRFIQTSPNMNDFSMYGRAEVNHVEQGGVGYEAGLAVGAPLIEDKIGFRASLSYRRAAGFVDEVQGTVTALPTPTTLVPPYDNLASFTPTNVIKKDANWRTALVGRLAVELRPTETLTITPSIYYQRVKNGDASDNFTVIASDLDKRDYRRISWQPGNPATNAALTPINVPQTDTGSDRFILSALDVELDLGEVKLISHTSYFDRKSQQTFDYTWTDSQAYGNILIPQPGFKSFSTQNARQKNFVQEVRAQSGDAQSFISWTVGAFYSQMKQDNRQDLFSNYIYNLPSLFGFIFNDADPFGPGYNAFTNAFGMGLGANSIYFREHRFADETQIAGFAQVDIRPIDRLTLTIGARYSSNKLKYSAFYPEALNNINAPFGAPCTDGICKPGQGNYVVAYPDTIGNSISETAFTPKFGVSFQATPDHLFYANVAKGFRPGGVSAAVPPVCNGDLRRLGYVDGSGNPTQRPTYGSDSVWSYEAGFKSRLLGNRLTLDGSAYRIDWTNIQTFVILPECGYDLTDNTGNARSEGFDLAFDLRVARGLNLGGAIGYNSSKFTKSGLVRADGVASFPKGSNVPGAPSPWTVNLSAQYDHDLAGGNGIYARLDYIFNSKQNPSGGTLVGTPNYNPLLIQRPSYANVNLRLGWRHEDTDISIFAKNLLNADPLLSLDPAGGRRSLVYQASTLTPRTIGITLTHRQ
ncbi:MULTISPECIES: TonB-dependent receptor [unclassified Sphingobium]|uniref:TonB-dependent receptor n=1 Tax=unclassified Sphingobium TaxID=2611147 RepID=UPI002223FE96|nr:MULTISPECIES: TonB-dependent receptor [unclassified Sphingobium]MCW2395772.1 outer membrane receptor protein involved in Fe transport [Sphingobium sp. B8D3B]MCW2419287.1 outer membrane receptor protein involved in Fe transport [Sphingobium sp. B8D3C]